MSVKRFYGREGKALPSLERQFASARKHGFGADELRGDGGTNVYIDRKPRVRQVEAADYWFAELVRHPLRGGAVYIENASILGGSEAEIVRRASAIGDAGGAIFDMSTDELVKITPEGRALLAFIGRARKLVGEVRYGAMQAGKRRTGNKGGKRPEFTDAQILKCKAPWLTATSQSDAAVKATAALGRPISYASVRRYAIANKWGERGADIVKRTPKKASAKRLKRRPR